ncbi:YPO3983 family protein [Siccibacter colletis]|uniref:YPO3983 family protein n=1 Tax=Siccibacter colletis TaxID=1505757 RepID=UPI0028BEBACD|nr:YPO3983 family protein [Siccibacter colletis]WNN47725.1 YPO3983 family protein [Siccibacter colletis]
MSAVIFPKIIFKTRRWMDDYSSDDMRYGDLSESQLRNDFRLTDISAHVDPWRLTAFRASPQRQSLLYSPSVIQEKITPARCASLLFDEFRQLARMFSFYGPYQHVIGEMITHMQKNSGMPFRSSSLDAALREQIMSDTREKSTIKRIKLVLQQVIDWGSNECSERIDARMDLMLKDSYLPKFMRFKDSFNGLGITVHDTCATHITIDSLAINNNRYRATVTYNVQDHFGLDKHDIRSRVFYQFRLFRLWFYLQRSQQFGYRPFMTNMQATVEITGGRDEKI